VMKLGVTGSREGWTSRQGIAMDMLLLSLYQPDIELHHGDCVGVDEMAARSAHHWGYLIVTHPPTNPKHRAWVDLGTIMPEKTYHSRNRDIVDSCELLLAVPKSLDRKGGTWNTIGYAASVNKPTIILHP